MTMEASPSTAPRQAAEGSKATAARFAQRRDPDWSGHAASCGNVTLVALRPGYGVVGRIAGLRLPS